MNTFFRRFNIFLTILLILSIIIAILFLLYFLMHGGVGNNDTLSGIIGKVSTILFLFIFILGFISLVAGVILGVVGKKKKDKESTSFAKRMIIHGIIKCIVSFVLFFVISLALSFFGLDLSSGPGLPVVGDPNSSDTGFPIKDLKIISKKTDTDDPTSCDITILNLNQTLGAANISVVVDDTENDYIFQQDHIAPGKTDSTSVSGSKNTKNPCDAIMTIRDAGIAKN
jgi:hypothetical protein